MIMPKDLFDFFMERLKRHVAEIKNKREGSKDD
jgi:hypothetical protein